MKAVGGKPVLSVQSSRGLEYYRIGPKPIRSSNDRDSQWLLAAELQNCNPEIQVRLSQWEKKETVKQIKLKMEKPSHRPAWRR